MDFTPTGIVREHSTKRVAYYYDEDIGTYTYGEDHFMKPLRIKLTHELIVSTGMYRYLEAFRPVPASIEDICKFHDPGYIDFIRTASYATADFEYLNKYNILDDCPLFNGLMDYCKKSCGGSIAAAIKMNKKESDIAINWMGGMHHAKKGKAGGFCYTNDAVLAIMELLKYHKRVLYLDIDAHHADGVEEAFYSNNRVMTVSFHKFGNFFPGTGSFAEKGTGEGKGYALNIPLLDGCSNTSYQNIFKPIVTEVISRYQPCIIVLQCGADSLCEDHLGPFNMNPIGHGECVSFIRKYDIPLMLMGGGGYNPQNVARCWTYETSLALNKEIGNVVPEHTFSDYYAPNYLLHFEPIDNTYDYNTKQYLGTIKSKVMKSLAKLTFAPSVQMQPIPEDSDHHVLDRSIALDLANPNKRLPCAVKDKMVQHENEFYDDEEEGDDRRNDFNAKRAAERCDNKGSPVKKSKENHGRKSK